jgi:hypothetical protein
MRLLKKRWPWISLAVFVCLVGLGFLSYRELDRRWQEMLESKWVRTTSATVIRKESFRCEEKSCLYTSGYGDRVEMRQGESQQRIYYRIENFDQVDDPRRSRAMEAEKKRVQESGPRFTYAEDWYDKVEPGEKVYVLYRCFSDGQIQVLRVDIKQ